MNCSLAINSCNHLLVTIGVNSNYSKQLLCMLTLQWMFQNATYSQLPYIIVRIIQIIRPCMCHGVHAYWNAAENLCSCDKLNIIFSWLKFSHVKCLTLTKKLYNVYMWLDFGKPTEMSHLANCTFLCLANSHIHTLPMHCSNTRLSWLVCFSRADFNDHVKSQLRTHGGH